MAPRGEKEFILSIISKQIYTCTCACLHRQMAKVRQVLMVRVCQWLLEVCIAAEFANRWHADSALMQPNTPN